MGAMLSVWGVRGSSPSAGRQFMEYGGNTSCFSLSCGDGLICFDAGSGLSALIGGLHGVDRLDIFLSHLHMDHIMGLFYLSAFKGNEIHLYCARGREELLRVVTDSPFWPLGFDDISAGVFLHGLGGGDRIELPCGACVDVIEGNHPNGSLYYRASLDGRSVTYALDCELEGDTFERLADFARDTDILIWDANFTRGDKQIGWGHSTWEEGLSLADAANARSVLMAHYSRDYTDDFIREQEIMAKQKSAACLFAREGMVLPL